MEFQLFIKADLEMIVFFHSFVEAMPRFPGTTFATRRRTSLTKARPDILVGFPFDLAASCGLEPWNFE